MAQPKLPQSAVTGVSKGAPKLINEIAYGTALGVFVGSFWKMYQVNARRKVEDFYTALEKGEITVEAS